MASVTHLMSTSIMLLWLFACTFCSSSDTSTSSADLATPYELYCRDTLTLAEKEARRQDIPPSSISSNLPLGFHRAFFSGGSPLFETNLTVFSLRRPEYSAIFALTSVKLEGEQAAEKYVVTGTLLLRNRSHLWSSAAFNRTTVFRQRRARRDPFLRLGGIKLEMEGLWVARSQTLCMAGCFGQNVMGQSNSRHDCQVKAVFQYPVENSIKQPLVKGVIESRRQRQDSLFFEPVHITGVTTSIYKFRKDDKNSKSWPMQRANVPGNIKVWNDETAVCQFPWYKQRLMVMWNKHCSGQDCSLFEGMIPGSPTYLSVENMVCVEGKSHGFFIFSDDSASSFQSRYHVLSVEGMWNTSTGQLYASACYLKGAAKDSLGFDSEDCDILITLQFPTTLSLLFRYSVAGRVERKKSSKLPSFREFSFTGHMDISYGSFGWERSPPRMEYAYTEERIKQARNHCLASSTQHSKRGWMHKGKLMYPDGQIFTDLGFQASMKDSSGSTVSAFFSPVAIDGRTNMFFNPSVGVVTSAASSENWTKSMNISFDINFYSMDKVIKPLENTTHAPLLPAEGVYDSQAGMLCLSACRSLAQITTQIGSKLYDGNKDCEIVITIQYPPINSGFFDKRKATGQMMSIREQKDSLFFNPVFVSSTSLFYQEQAAETLMEKDFEIIMGIVSLTMSVIFIGLQLRHVKKNPKVLPQMSLLMLTMLTLGHLIPLVLNFEAIFSSRSRQNVLQWSGGWLEINEVIVRLMTMLVFLMLLRLLYLSWVSKSEVSPGEGPWHMERGALRICLTVYALGALSALIVYGIKGSNVLDVAKGFAGVIVDFFLFPQVVGNYLWEIQGTVLSSPFYLGMTLVRALPHLYDVLRKLEFFSADNWRYYYANPTWDYYSNAWDVIIPFGTVLHAVLLCVQQRYGGSCFSLRFWRKTRPYIKVSMNPI